MYILRMSKIQPPVLSQNILHRTSLVETLHAAIVAPSSTYKLVLVCAPAGYGKTTLLVDFADKSGIACCWYFFDNSDTSICSFIQTLLASIRCKIPSFGNNLDAYISALCNSPDAQLQELYRFTDHFINALGTDISERFTLFLCNYHTVNKNQMILEFMNRLLRYLPAHCVLVMESRAIPALRLTSLMAHEHLLGLGSGKLRFRAEEIRELSRLQLISPFSDEEADYLAHAFDGWIVGILLNTRLGHGHLFSKELSTYRDSSTPLLQPNRQALFSYMLEEVFPDEPENYAFLKAVSLLSYMTPEICNELLEITEAGLRLRECEQRGLFVTCSGNDSRGIYTCHPSFRELLYEESYRENTERMLALHRKAAAIFLRLEDYDQAIAHAMATHDDEWVASLIVGISKHFLQQGDLETLARWIDALTPDALDHSPELLLIRANIYIYGHEYSQAQILLKQALYVFRHQLPFAEKECSPLLEAEMLVAESTVLFHLGDYLQVQTLCQQALARLPADEQRLCASVYHRLGTCSCILGNLQEGTAQFHQALHLWGHHTSDDLVADIHCSLANAYSLQSNSALAEHHRSRASSIYEQTGNMRSNINNMIWKAISLRNRGEFAEAEKLFLEVIEKAQQEQFLSGQAYAYFSLGETYLDQDRFEEALHATADALAQARKIEDNYLINQSLCSLALEYLFMSDVSTALQFLDQIVIKTASTTGYEKALSEQTRGTIFLRQNRYKEAYTWLQGALSSLSHGEFARLNIQICVRLAICQDALGQSTEAEETMERAAALAQRCNYVQLISIELRRFPAFWKKVQAMSEQACLPEWLPAGTKAIREKDPVPEVPVIAQLGREPPYHLSIHAFGEPAIAVWGVPITRWRMARSIELCFFLLDYNRPIRQEQILTALWDEVDENIHQTLRSAIHHLRKTLGAACLVYESKMYTLNLAALYGESIWYDVTVFRSLFEEAQKAKKEEDIPAVKNYLQKAVDLYRGDYVHSFYGNWCVARRRELRQLYIEYRRELASMAWQEEQFEECATHWQQMLAVDNCLEEAHYHLMRCYLRLGRRGMVLRQYQRCVEILQEELAVSPGPSIQRLYQRLTNGSI